jgi:GT2 family glycosyltransferase
MQHSSSLAVVLCSYGQDHLTHRVLLDLTHTEALYSMCVVDNKGSFRAPLDGRTQVLRPGRNLGWAKGSNRGVRFAMASQDVEAVILLNNDVRLSRNFLDGLLEAWRATSGDVIGPVYDHNWPQQRTGYLGEPERYEGQRVERLVPFVDGTCMLISRSAIDRDGLLDEAYWPEWGWGCDKDYCLRVRLAGGSVYVTERSYLSHDARGTARLMADFSEAKAEEENDKGMYLKWGSHWKERLYEGFDYERLGLTQRNLIEQKRRGTSV